MLYAILCYDSEDVVGAWTKEEFYEQVAEEAGEAADDPWVDAAVHSFFGTVKAFLGEDADRVANLRGGANGLPALNSTTVLTDADADSLRGGKGVDWFFSGSSDVLGDRTSTEQRN